MYVDLAHSRGVGRESRVEGLGIDDVSATPEARIAAELSNYHVLRFLQTVVYTADSSDALLSPPVTTRTTDARNRGILGMTRIDLERSEPAALPAKTGGPLSRKWEYVLFYVFAILSWSLEICAAATGSHYGGSSYIFVGIVVGWLACHFAAMLQTCWIMATSVRSTFDERMAYLNLAIRLQRLLAVSRFLCSASRKI